MFFGEKSQYANIWLTQQIFIEYTTTCKAECGIKCGRYKSDIVTLFTKCLMGGVTLKHLREELLPAPLWACKVFWLENKLSKGISAALPTSGWYSHNHSFFSHQCENRKIWAASLSYAFWNIIYHGTQFYFFLQNFNTCHDKPLIYQNSHQIAFDWFQKANPSIND